MVSGVKSRILATRPLGFPWETTDPFLFCVHHDDRYPAGEDNMAPHGDTLRMEWPSGIVQELYAVAANSS